MAVSEIITAFCGKAEKRMLTRGKNLYRSNKVVSFTYDEYSMLTGRVEASMRKVSYKVWVSAA